MLGVLPFGEDPDLSGTAGPAVPQHLPPCMYVDTHVADGSQVNNESVISFSSAVAEL